MPTYKEHQLLGCKLFPGRDDDIIDWVASIPKGQISDYLKGAIRYWLHGGETSQSNQVSADVPPIFTEMYQMLRELIERPAVQIVSGQFTEAVAVPPDDALDEQEIQERMRNMANIDFGDWG